MNKEIFRLTILVDEATTLF